MILKDSEMDAANAIAVARKASTSGPPTRERLPSYSDSVDPPLTPELSCGSSATSSTVSSPGSEVVLHPDHGVYLSDAYAALARERQPISRKPSQQDTRAFGPVVYNFNNVSYHSMVLQLADDPEPHYHISVHLNCFIPSSYITVLRKGGSEEGEVLGSFEMGISQKKPTITINGVEKFMSTILVKSGTKSDRAVWQWRWHNDQDLHLSWHCDSPVKYCYLHSQAGTPNATLLASFTTIPLAPRADGKPAPPPSLKLFPDGHRLVDHIIISALIIERQRLMPTPKSQKSLFG
ncbi:hypothetical protein OBBRIDRAFT_838924 [Obba rivulosa]|uniref:DUF6593 domain-containing protein n=1 Tax=Obba rivulosa TaxID=1052685 RepID=A0A8E2ARQ7_9APHY|nr:hypothetical protein OBBRIDRAFT_838924 [Obba rivulosa]